MPPTVVIDGTKIKQIRESKGLTQDYLATVVDVAIRTVSRWENNRSSRIRLENAEKLADALEVSLEDITLSQSEVDDKRTFAITTKDDRRTVDDIDGGSEGNSIPAIASDFEENEEQASVITPECSKETADILHNSVENLTESQPENNSWKPANEQLDIHQSRKWRVPALLVLFAVILVVLYKYKTTPPVHPSTNTSSQPNISGDQLEGEIRTVEYPPNDILQIPPTSVVVDPLPISTSTEKSLLPDTPNPRVEGEIKAERCYLPDHTAPGQPFPVVIKVSSSFANSISFILKELLPPFCSASKGDPKFVLENGTLGAIKWVNNTERKRSLYFSYLVNTEDFFEQGRVLYFSGKLMANADTQEDQDISGPKKMTIMNYHWADRNKNNVIDDREILTIYNFSNMLEGIGIDIEKIKQLWASTEGYRWNEHYEEFELQSSQEDQVHAPLGKKPLSDDIAVPASHSVVTEGAVPTSVVRTPEREVDEKTLPLPEEYGDDATHHKIIVLKAKKKVAVGKKTQAAVQPAQAEMQTDTEEGAAPALPPIPEANVPETDEGEQQIQLEPATNVESDYQITMPEAEKDISSDETPESQVEDNGKETEPELPTPEPQKAVQTRPPSESSCMRPWKTPLAEISGQITKIEIKPLPWTSQRGLHLEVEISSGSYLIHVFPEKLMAQCQELFNFKAGEKVTVSGSEFSTGKGRNLCAATITRGADVLQLRDPLTSTFENQLCCQQLCQQQCNGRPEKCMNNCLSRCRRSMKAQEEAIIFSKGTIIKWHVLIPDSPPAAFIITQRIPPEINILASSPPYHSYDKETGTVKWLLTDVKPGKLSMQMKLDTLITKQSEIRGEIISQDKPESPVSSVSLSPLQLEPIDVEE